MTKITNLPHTAIIAGALIALAAGPAFAQSNNVPEALDEIIEILNAQQGAIDDLQNAVEGSENLLEPRTIFVTSDTYTGDLVMEANDALGTSFSDSEGLEAGDALCQDLADADGSIVPEGEYVALLSTGEVGAASRITPSSGPYVRPDGVPVAASFAALFSTRFTNTDFDLLSRVRGDELGNLFGSEVVWTNTTSNGLVASTSCADWSSAAGSTIAGDTNELDADWLDGPFPSCGDSARLYCVLR